jgi:phosphoglycerol transferase MdoB-like AlkP superfamily enzyme
VDLPAAKNTISLCRLKCYCILFLLVQCVVVVVWFVVGESFFFLFFSLSSLKNYILIVYVVDISISILILLISISTSRACQRGLTWFLLELIAAPK